MGRYLLTINTASDRAKAARWAMAAPFGMRLEFKETKRSLPQNAHMWAALTDVATQQLYHGIRLSTEEWKLLFLDALKREVRLIPNLDGTGFVPMGRSSSDLSIEEMTGMITLIHEYGARHGVVFHDNLEAAA